MDNYTKNEPTGLWMMLLDLSNCIEIQIRRRLDRLSCEEYLIIDLSYEWTEYQLQVEGSDESPVFMVTGGRRLRFEHS